MSTEVLVTGASGTLGRQVVTAALAAGQSVRALSRRAHADDRVRWYAGDLLKATGVGPAVTGADVIVHCATQFAGDKDLRSTANLLAAARRAGVTNVVYISIVGVDQIPLGYYRTKLRVEQALAASGAGHTILRATQFHELIAAMFAVQRFAPMLGALRGVSFQPIDAGDAARRLVELAGAEPAGRVADIGGPEVRTHADLGRAYLSARGSRRPVIQVPLPGRIGAGYRRGAHLAPDNPIGVARFEDYLARS